MPSTEIFATHPPLEERLRRSVLARLLGLLALILLLQIPIEMIQGTIGEREVRRQEAIGDVTRAWGGRQIVRGPFLVVPYVERQETKGEISETPGYRYVLPERLATDGDLTTEVRRRGIFDVALYVTHLSLEGAFRLPGASAFPSKAVIAWDQAALVLAISDPKSLRENVVVTWGNRPLPMQPGTGGHFDLSDTGLHAAVPVAGTDSGGEQVAFSLDIVLAGSGGLSVLPAGSESTLRLRSGWPDPSFDGAYLPTSDVVTPQGFEANWRVLQLARSFPSSWNRGEICSRELDASLIGVSLLSPVDAYRTTDRAVKYELLFLGLTFLAFVVLELIAGLRLHAVQYLLVGLALCLFYLLLLSLAEHVGFGLAYAVASAAIALLVTAYSRAVLRSRARTAGIAAVVASLYLYLFFLLQIQDYALLVGSTGLFAVLAAVMYLTRKVNWYDPTALHVDEPAGARSEA